MQWTWLPAVEKNLSMKFNTYFNFYCTALFFIVVIFLVVIFLVVETCFVHMRSGKCNPYANKCNPTRYSFVFRYLT